MRTRSLLQKSACSTLFIAGVGFASASTFVLTEDELDAETFPLAAESIVSNLEGSNEPNGLTSARKAQVRRSLVNIQRFLDDDAVGNHQKIRSEQKRINTALTPAVAKDDGKSEVVCRRIMRVGTKIPSTECRTREEMEREEYLAEEVIRINRDQDGHSRRVRTGGIDNM